VPTLVVLADLRRGWLPQEDVFQVGGFESRLKFPICKLIDRLDGDWWDDHSLPVLVARAQIEALRTAGDAEGRYRAKRLLVLGLYDLGYNEPGEARKARTPSLHPTYQHLAFRYRRSRPPLIGPDNRRQQAVGLRPSVASPDPASIHLDAAVRQRRIRRTAVVPPR
jgi:hypothetical protein